jgi:hypothetical protein
MRTQTANGFSNSAPDERTGSDVVVPPSVEPETDVETSVVELSALLIVILAGFVLTFAGAAIALVL